VTRLRQVGVAILLVGLSLSAAYGEVIEEIVALVNGEIITRSDLDEQEQLMVAEIYRQYSGAELDKRLADIKNALLLELIDAEIRFHYAKRQFDTERLRESFYEQFVQQQMQEYNIESEEAFLELLARDNMTVDELKDRLLRTFAPEEVLRYEVGSRIAIDDPEIETYYQENPLQFLVPGEATVREIVLLGDTEQKRSERMAEATAIVQRVRDGESFEALAKELSEAGTQDQEGLLGTVARGDLSDQLEEVAFAMEANDVSDPIDTPYGLHIIKIDAITPDQTRPYDEVKEPLRGFLESRKYAEDVRAFTLKVRGQADWCVKNKYIGRLPDNVEPQICTEM